MRRLPVLALLLACRTTVGSPAHPEDTTERASPARCTQPSIAVKSRLGEVHRIADVTVEVDATGPVARTRLTLALPPPSRRHDAAFVAFDLPKAFVVTDFQVEARGGWESTHIVEREAGDPIDEAIAASPFRDREHVVMRVDLAPRSDGKRVRLTWVQPALVDEGGIDVPLCGLPEIDTLTLSVRDGEAKRTRTWHDHTPTTDLHVPLSSARPHAIRNADWVATTIAAAPPPPLAAPSVLTFLVDTSASRASTFDRDLATLARVLAELARHDADVGITVIAFDQRSEVVYDGSARGSAVAIDRLRERGAIGATDLVDALTRLQIDGAGPRLVAVTDGLSTLGAIEDADVAALVDRFANTDVERIDVLAPRDAGSALLDHLAERGRDPGRVLVLEAGPRAIVHALSRPFTEATVAVPGAKFVSLARWTYPEGKRLLFVQLAPSAPFRPEVAGASLLGAPELGACSISALGHAARLDDLEHELALLPIDDEEWSTVFMTLVDLGRRHRLVGDYTARTTMGAQLARAPLPAASLHRGPTVGEYARLVRRQRRFEERQRVFMSALEAWGRARAEGRDPGPRPRVHEMDTAKSKQRATDVYARVHAGVGEPRLTPAFAKVERAIDRDALDHARELADAWFAREPGVFAALAGARVAAADRRPDRVARWLGATFETVTPADPLFGAGLYFVDFARAEAHDVETMIDAVRLEYGEDRHLLTGLAALARGEPALAAESFGAAVAVAEDSGPTRGLVVPHGYARLIGIAAAATKDGRAHAVRRRFAIAPLRGPQRLLVLTATNVDPETLVLLVESSDDEPLFTSVDGFGLPRGEVAGMVLQSIRPRRDGDRALLHAPGVPVVGALFVVELDDDGRAAVTQHPFAFTEKGSTLSIDL